ncbi:MAG: hypothetical protein M1826_007682 [Phylliscum demangeonii]|nr:MAG: hypothetical protein M1826_007682 [Phylliscum demangeonii]
MSDTLISRLGRWERMELTLLTEADHVPMLLRAWQAVVGRLAGQAQDEVGDTHRLYDMPLRNGDLLGRTLLGWPAGQIILEFSVRNELPRWLAWLALMTTRFNVGRAEPLLEIRLGRLAVVDLTTADLSP